MSEMAAVGVTIVGGLLVGWLLSRRYHSESRTLESIARIPFNLAWILAGAFAIIGGYRTTGLVILILWSYFFFSNTKRVREGDIDVSPSGWRRRAGNWNPYDRSD